MLKQIYIYICVYVYIYMIFTPEFLWCVSTGCVCVGHYYGRLRVEGRNYSGSA